MLGRLQPPALYTTQLLMRGLELVCLIGTCPTYGTLPGLSLSGRLCPSLRFLVRTPQPAKARRRRSASTCVPIPAPDRPSLLSRQQGNTQDSAPPPTVLLCSPDSKVILRTVTRPFLTVSQHTEPCRVLSLLAVHSTIWALPTSHAIPYWHIYTTRRPGAPPAIDASSPCPARRCRTRRCAQSPP